MLCWLHVSNRLLTFFIWAQQVAMKSLHVERINADTRNAANLEWPSPQMIGVVHIYHSPQITAAPGVSHIFGT